MGLFVCITQSQGLRDELPETDLIYLIGTSWSKVTPRVFAFLQDTNVTRSSMPRISKYKTSGCVLYTVIVSSVVKVSKDDIHPKRPPVNLCLLHLQYDTTFPSFGEQRLKQWFPDTVLDFFSFPLCFKSHLLCLHNCQQWPTWTQEKSVSPFKLSLYTVIPSVIFWVLFFCVHLCLWKKKKNPGR